MFHQNQMTKTTKHLSFPSLPISTSWLSKKQTKPPPKKSSKQKQTSHTRTKNKQKMYQMPITLYRSHSWPCYDITKQTKSQRVFSDKILWPGFPLHWPTTSLLQALVPANFNNPAATAQVFKTYSHEMKMCKFFKTWKWTLLLIQNKYAY